MECLINKNEHLLSTNYILSTMIGAILEKGMMTVLYKATPLPTCFYKCDVTAQIKD